MADASGISIMPAAGDIADGAAESHSLGAEESSYRIIIRVPAKVSNTLEKV